MTSAPGLEASAARARAARARLASTAQEIQSRLAPAQLLDEAVDSVKSGATAMAVETATVVRARPGIVAGGAALVIAWFARKPVARLGRRLRGRGTE